jgi:hypothetical protein
MKKIFTTLSLTFILLLGVRTNCTAQTTLSAGDIAFIGLYTSGSGGVGDAFSFITLKTLSAGTVIYFTDDGWNNGAWGGSSSEVHFTWSPPAGGTPIGTIVTITGGAIQTVPGTPSSGTCSATFLAGTTWHYPSGDEILAYQSSSGARPTSPTFPTFIAGMMTYYNTGIYDAITKWCSTTVGFTEMASTLPLNLENGVNCVSVKNANYNVSTTNCRYNGTLTGTASAVRALINNDANWTRSTTTPFDITSAAFPTPSITAPVAPTVTTQAVSSIAATTATGNGNITVLGVPNPTAYGVCWNTTGTPTNADSKADNGDASATGAFTAAMTGLTANTTYHVRAYATNTAGTSYGTEVTFTTSAVAPTVTTQAVSSITATTATGNGNVTATGGANITERGVYWSTTDGFANGTGTKVSTIGNWSTTGTFTQEITGLSSGTIYYVKAFATNSSGSSYGLQVSFTTKATPLITWSNPADIAYGTLLSATQLNATANTAGTFTYTPALGTKLNAGNGQTLKVDFTPTDLTNYEATSKTVIINVAKATPVIMWSNPAGITYGTLLSATQLNATADVAGSMVYTPAIGTKLNAGVAQDLKADFTPTDATNYNNATKTVKIDVAKATPVITWSNPADINNATALSNTQLNAGADVPGTFTYTPAIGAKLNVGNAQVLKADFVPTDLINYESASKTVLINVTLATGISAVENNELIVLYPNPVIEAFNILGMDSKATISITDLNGKVVLTKEISADEKVYVTDLPCGIYLIKIITNKGTILKKIVKK